jgi:hypothetical protein
MFVSISGEKQHHTGLSPALIAMLSSCISSQGDCVFRVFDCVPALEEQPCQGSVGVCQHNLPSAAEGPSQV